MVTKDFRKHFHRSASAFENLENLHFSICFYISFKWRGKISMTKWRDFFFLIEVNNNYPDYERWTIWIALSTFEPLVQRRKKKLNRTCTLLLLIQSTMIQLTQLLRRLNIWKLKTKIKRKKRRKLVMIHKVNFIFDLKFRFVEVLSEM